MATHSSVLAWRIPGTVEPGGLPSMGSHSRTRLKRLSSSSSRDGRQDTGGRREGLGEGRNRRIMVMFTDLCGKFHKFMLMSKLTKFHDLNICRFFSLNYISIKLHGKNVMVVI